MDVLNVYMYTVYEIMLTSIKHICVIWYLYVYLFLILLFFLLFTRTTCFSSLCSLAAFCAYKLYLLCL